ncbi:C2 family cysteine protease [Brachybacterium vulturis]|uniref:C2 family cysteine protease n=1 Tax=Brachybacterium vulturis TaxID=2017484 RepID=UPI0037367260
MIRLGADTEMVRAHAQAMRTGTGALRERISALGSAIRSVAWTGSDAEEFRATAGTRLAEATTLLDGIDRRSDELLEHAVEQDRVSSADGLGSGGDGPEGPDGDQAGTVKDPGDAEGTDPAHEDIPEDDEALDPDDSAQGSIGDCYLLSSLQSLAQRDPDFLRQHVEEVEPGLYEVTMFDEDGEAIVYQVESVQEGGVRGAEGDQSVYSLYERAYAMHLDARGVDIDGGFPEDAMETLTGQGADAYDSLSIDELAEQLDRGHLVNADTGGIDDPGHDQIVGNHAYTVSSVDTEAGTVTVTNPWAAGDPNAPKNVTLSYEKYRESFGRTTVGRTAEKGVFEGIGIGDGIGWL